MDARIFGTAFLTVFLAELGDKTQLATFTLAAGSGSRLSVLAGAALALCLTTALAVLAGELVGRAVPERGLRIAAGAAFVILGASYLWGALRG